MKYTLILFLCLKISCGYAQPATVADSQVIPGIHFIKTLSCTPVEDQSVSPTCWVFGSNSLFATDLMNLKKIEVNLSEMFIARHAYIDKARQYLRTGGKTYFEGGGQFRDVLRVIKKYGMVPEEFYNGRPRGETNHNHANLDTAMIRYTRNILAAGNTDLSKKHLKQINDTLDKYLGKVPLNFVYKNHHYTPKTFATKYLQFNPDDYVELISFANIPYNKKFMLADKYNWAFDSFYNVALSDLEMVIDSALAKGFTVGWEGDVTESGFDYLTGVATLSGKQQEYDSTRVANYKNESTERDHMLHLIGRAQDEDNRKWYYLKNSWGNTNSINGYMFMQAEYLRLKTVIIMVNKKALPAIIRKQLSLP